MNVYHLYRRQRLRMDLSQAWRFFSSPHFLNAITPDFFSVSIISKVPESIYGGLLIHYKMRAVLGLPMTWVSEIRQCDEPRRFVYTQLVGPFKFWSHEVCLTECAEGVVMEDIVYYAMPFAIVGDVLHRLWIGRRLQAIFSHRAEVLEQQWGGL